MVQALSTLDGYDVVPITLTSTGADPKKWQATKDNIRDALARLAGAQTPAKTSTGWDIWQTFLAKIRNILEWVVGRLAPRTLSGIPGADQLAQATPDDLVIVTFSGHGYTTK